MTEEITIRETSDEATGAVPTGHQASTGGASVSRRTERRLDRYLYENLISNLECQVSAWIRRAEQESDPEVAQGFWSKAEGLGYAMRLLFAFKPEFEELVEKGEMPTCQGCGAGLDHSAYRQATDSSLCDACYEIGRDQESFIAENAADLDGQCWR